MSMSIMSSKKRLARELTARWSATTLAEALHLANTAAALEQLDVLQTIVHPVQPTFVADALRLDPNMLAGALEFLTRRTDLVRKTAGGYLTGPGYDAHARFTLRLYVGAFGP